VRADTTLGTGDNTAVGWKSWPLLAKCRHSGVFSTWLFGGTTLHLIYDYPQCFAAVNLRTVSIRRCRLHAFCRSPAAPIVLRAHS